MSTATGDFEHLIIKSGSGEDAVYRIECLLKGQVHGFEECREPHDGAPGDGDNVHEFHGVTHTYHPGCGWTVPYRGCPVVAADWEPPAELHDLPAGRYPVEDDWDEYAVTLELVGGAL